MPTAATNRRSWRLVTTPPMSGERNMAYDLATLAGVETGRLSPTLRFFRWSEPTLSYGRLQRLEAVRPLIPPGWKAVQRPTGGGIVRHDGDLCFSLCWRLGEPPLPERVRDVYPWVHELARQALRPLVAARLAAGPTGSVTPSSFDTRSCFTEPVAFDLLAGRRKILGGALCCRRGCGLYQGSIQGIPDGRLEDVLTRAFRERLGGTAA